MGQQGSANILNEPSSEALEQNAQQWQQFGLRRNTAGLSAPITPIRADFTQLGDIQDAIEATKPDYLLLTLTPSAYSEQAYRQSYERATENIIQACKQLGHTPKLIIFASSTSVYGQNDGSWVDEDSPIAMDSVVKPGAKPVSFSASTMLACEALLRDSELPSCSVRFAGIYGSDTLRLVDRVQRGELSGSPAYSNRIHRLDCARILAHILEMHVQGHAVNACYNAVDNEPCALAEVEDWLCEHIATLPLAKADGGSANKLRYLRKVASKRCSNQRLRDSGFEFKYPDYRVGYTEILREAGLFIE